MPMSTQTTTERVRCRCKGRSTPCRSRSCSGPGDGGKDRPALRLEAGGRDCGRSGRVRVRDRRLCCAVESDDAHGPVGSEPELASRLSSTSASPPGPVPLRARSASTTARARRSTLSRQRSSNPPSPRSRRCSSSGQIEARIPSLDATVRLAPVLGTDEIVVTAAEWPAARRSRSGERRLVRDLDAGPAPMIEVCRTVADLVDRARTRPAARPRCPRSASPSPVTAAARPRAPTRHTTSR